MDSRIYAFKEFHLNPTFLNLKLVYDKMDSSTPKQSPRKHVRSVMSAWEGVLCLFHEFRNFNIYLNLSCIYAHVYVDIYTCMHIYIHVYLCLYFYIFIFIYIHIYIFIFCLFVYVSFLSHTLIFSTSMWVLMGQNDVTFMFIHDIIQCIHIIMHVWMDNGGSHKWL